MRLIDADELLKKAIATDEWEDPNDGSTWSYVVYEEDIKDTPTIDAIPIEWIERWLDSFLGVKTEEEIETLDPKLKDGYYAIFMMYNDWRRGDGK